MAEIKLPSGRLLTVQLAPFADSKALYQVLLEEMKGLKLDPLAEVDVNFYKDLFCAGFSSKKVEANIWQCMKRVLIDNLKVDENTFEPEAHRDDYFTVLFEVMKANITPFTKNLSAQLSAIQGMLNSAHA